MKMPSQPAAIAARARTGASSPSPEVDIPRPAGSLHGMGRVKNHAIAGFPHPIERAKIGHEIVVTESGAAFGEKKPVVSKSGQFFRDVFHIPGREELAFLHIDNPPGFRRGPQQIGLAAKKRRDLQDVDDLSRDLRFRRRMDIGRYRNFQFRADAPRISHPSSTPIPRKERTEVRFALS